MNVLILNGSPRMKGNTRTVLKYMEEQLSGQHTVTFVDVCRRKISGCLACNGCKKNGGHCICPDESDALMQQVIAADAIIIGTPVYWWGMSSQLKMAVDKFYSCDAKLREHPKKLGILAIGAESTDDIQYSLIREQFSCIAKHLNWELAFSLSFSAYEPGEITQNEDAFEQSKQAIIHLF